MTVKPWIQSLLLTSGHHPSLEIKSDLSSGNEVVGKRISSLPVGASIQTTSTTQMSVGRPLAEIVNEHGIF